MHLLMFFRSFRCNPTCYNFLTEHHHRSDQPKLHTCAVLSGSCHSSKPPRSVSSRSKSGKTMSFRGLAEWPIPSRFGTTKSTFPVSGWKCPTKKRLSRSLVGSCFRFRCYSWTTKKKVPTFQWLHDGKSSCSSVFVYNGFLLSTGRVAHSS